MKIKVLAIAAAVLLIVGLGACKDNGVSSGEGSSSTVSEQDLSLFPSGVIVGGVDVSGKSLDEAIKLCKDSLQSNLKTTAVNVKVGKSAVKIEGTDINATDVCSELLEQIFKTRKAGSYQLKLAVDSEKIGDLLDDAASKYNVEAKNASIGGFDPATEIFSFTKEENGRRVDITKTAAKVAELFETGKGGTMEAVVAKKAATVTVQELESQYVKIGSFSTVSDNNENGNHNMALSFERINGTVLQQGEEFSFNQIVGDSTYDGSGFLPAGGLVGGVLVPLYGGGICQSSSTIYGAALRAGMEITLRDCHSSPSTYVPIGLDATVSYTDLDFRFVNPYDFPVYISSYMVGVELYVSIYGRQPKEWDSIEISSWETGQEPIPEGVRYLEDNSLATGEYYVKSYGNIGYYAAAQRVFYKNGEAVRTEELSPSYYGPMKKTYMVGPGTNTDTVTGESGGGA